MKESWNKTGVECVQQDVLLQQIVGVIMTAIVILLGLSANTLSFILLTRTKRTSMFIILQSLLLSDSVVLFFYFVSQVLPNLFELADNVFFTLAHKVHGYLLRTAWPLVMTAQMTSVWLTVLISIERWFAVCKPFAIRAFLTKERTSNFVIGIFIIALVYNLPRYFEYNLCTQLEAQYFSAAHSHRSSSDCPAQDEPIQCLNESSVWNSSTWIFVRKSAFGESEIYTNTYCAVMYCLLLLFVPVSLIGALNAQTIIHLRRSRSQWTALTRAQRQEERITLLPIWIVGLFCVCSTPSTLTNLVEALQITVDDSLWRTVVPVTNLFVMLNSAINCIVYCALSRRFREIFLQLFCKRHAKTPVGSTPRSTIRSQYDSDQSRGKSSLYRLVREADPSIRKLSG